MIHYQLTTHISETIFFVTDQYADDEPAAITAHLQAFAQHHPADEHNYRLTWVVMPPKPEMGVVGVPA